MKKLVVIIFAMALSLAAGLAQAGKGAPAMKRKIMKELGLNNTQIKKIEGLTYKADRKKIDFHHEMQKAHLDLQQLMSADKPNEAAVFAQLEKISALELKLKKNRVGLMLKIRELMTAEQWEKLELFQEHRKAKRRERRMRRRFKSGPGSGPPPDAPGPPHGPGPDAVPFAPPDI
ncbi:MAG: periplasmic heavy metal sensor [Deltaproteobacteria bacterium]|nr:periplasmic heavy metal sensor [Deltaproteobacteria bacterium]MBW1872898.1 periplasmic heavy metal sensor [Deltaproteobacteria bacterium]